VLFKLRVKDFLIAHILHSDRHHSELRVLFIIFIGIVMVCAHAMLVPFCRLFIVVFGPLELALQSVYDGLPVLQLHQVVFVLLSHVRVILVDQLHQTRLLVTLLPPFFLDSLPLLFLVLLFLFLQFLLIVHRLLRVRWLLVERLVLSRLVQHQLWQLNGLLLFLSLLFTRIFLGVSDELC
jgi:hypothetical protein